MIPHPAGFLRPTSRSLRSRLMIGIAVTTLLVLICTTVVVSSLIRQMMYDEFDGLLEAKARALATMIEQEGEAIQVEFAEHQLQEFARRERPEYYQVWKADGSVIARSRRLGDGALPLVLGSRIAPGVQAVTLPDGRPGRAVGVRFLPRVEGERLATAPLVPQTEETDDLDDQDEVDFASRTSVTLVVARDTLEIDRKLSHLAWLHVGSALTAACLIVGVLAWLVTHSLRPVDDLAGQIGLIDEKSLAGRISVANAPDELQPVISRLNDLIARLNAAFQREKTFTADIAHELRTPLAGIGSTLAVALSRERDNSNYREAMRQTLRICERTQKMVETLLLLTRVEAGRETLDRAFVDVKLVLHDCWQTFAAHAAEKGLSIVWDCPTGLILSTDATMFRVLLTNLFDNSVTYADRCGQIRVECGLNDDSLLLRMANTGCALSEHEAEAVFERFWRADVSRTDTGIHAGLGLALCRRILSVLDGEIGVTIHDGLFDVAVTFDRKFVDVAPQEETGDVPVPEMCVS